MCEIAEGLRRDRRAWRPGAEPSCDVLLRPEEIHRTSREDDVVPPVCCGDETVEQQIGAIRPLLDDLDGILLAAVRTRRLDASVDLERAENAEGVPSAVGIP